MRKDVGLDRRGEDHLRPGGDQQWLIVLLNGQIDHRRRLIASIGSLTTADILPHRSVGLVGRQQGGGH